VILSDTVGFISDLPTELVAAFRATLEEVLAADLIVHVRDISHPESEEQARDVRTILESLGVRDTTPQIEVWNKIDKLDDDARQAVQTRAARHEHVQALSAVTGEGMTDLVSVITHAMTDTTQETHVHLAFNEGRKRAWLYDRGLIEEERQTEEGFDLTVRWTARQQAQFDQV